MNRSSMSPTRPLHRLAVLLVAALVAGAAAVASVV